MFRARLRAYGNTAPLLLSGLYALSHLPTAPRSPEYCTLLTPPICSIHRCLYPPSPFHPNCQRTRKTSMTAQFQKARIVRGRCFSGVRFRFFKMLDPLYLSLLCSVTIIDIHVKTLHYYLTRWVATRFHRKESA